MKKLINNPYLINLWLLGLIFLWISASNQFAPLGSQSVLTIDLSQQYVDFFQGLSWKSLIQPQQFIYSFSKGIGGEMIGHYAYYLLSPFNWLFFFLPDWAISDGVTYITMVKIYCISAAMTYYLSKRYPKQVYLQVIISLSYSLMSYVVLYAMNLMWLDALIFLPLIVFHLEEALRLRKSYLTYILLLGASMLIHYYTAFMIAIFLGLYASYLLVIDSSTNMISKCQSFLRFLLASCLSTGLAAIILVPVAMSLAQNKVSTGSFDWTWSLNFSFDQLLSKNFNGAFLFEAIKRGPAPVYAGALISLALIYYFTSRIAIREKIASLVFLSIYLMFEWIQPLNLLHHGGIAPVWYPYRYQFVLSFFILVLAAKGLASIDKKPRFIQTLMAILVTSLIFAYYFYHIESFIHLQAINLWLTLAISFIVILVLELPWTSRSGLHMALLLIVVMDLGTNALFSIQQFGYINQPDYLYYQSTLSQLMGQIDYGPEQGRMTKTFGRTRNESLAYQYAGTEAFNSTLDYRSTELFGYLGLADPEANIAYGGGVPFIDDFLGVGIQVSLEEPIQKTYGLSNRVQTLIKDTSQEIKVNKLTFYLDLNPDHFSYAMRVNRSILDNPNPLHPNQPAANQNWLIQQLDPAAQPIDYYQELTLTLVQSQSLQLIDQAPGEFLTYQSTIMDPLTRVKGSLTYQFTPTSDDPYFISIPSQLNKDHATLSLNGLELNYFSPFTSRQLNPLPEITSGKTYQVQLDILQSQQAFNPIRIFQFDMSAYQEFLSRIKPYRFNLQQISPNQLTGSIESWSEDDYLLISLPYDPNWSAKVNGKAQPIVPALNDTLMVLPLEKGQNQVELAYFPKSLFYGTIITLLSVIGYLALVLFHKRAYFKKRRPS